MSIIVSDGTIVDIMPRSVDSDEKPKRATRKRATSTRARRTAPAAAVAEKPTRRRAPRRRTRAAEATPEPVIEKKVAPKKVATETRKAPTTVGASKARKKAKRNQMIVVGVLMLIGIGSSAMVGFTDDGRIDVNEAIEARNERIRSGQIEDPQSIVVPVQNTNANQLPDGGLVGLGVGAAPPPPPEPVATSTASSTASSTDEVASSTDAEIEEGETDNDENAEGESVDETPAEDENLEEAIEPEVVDEVDVLEAPEEGV